MSEPDLLDPAVEVAVRNSFARQQALASLGAELVNVAAGEIEIAFPFRAQFSQQHGFLHGGIVATVLDSACGYSALSLFPAGSEVLTIEFKINFTRPAKGDRFVARGSVISRGRRIMVSTGTVHSIQPNEEKLVATMTATLIKAETTD